MLLFYNRFSRLHLQKYPQRYPQFAALRQTVALMRSAAKFVRLAAVMPRMKPQEAQPNHRFQRTKPPMILAISTTFVRPVNSNFTLPSPEKYISSSESRSKEPAVSTENTTILL